MIFFELLNPLGIDFTVYWEASYMFLHHLDPYHGIFSSTFPFNYPPPSYLFLWWLGFLPKATAAPIWNFASLGAVILSIWLLLRTVQARVNKWLFFALCLLFTLPFFPVKFDIGNGQINHFLLLFCVLAVFFYERGRKNLSAVFLAYAIGIKFAPVIFIFYFLIRKDFKQIFRVIFWTIVIFAASFLFIPLKQQLEYYLHVLPLSFTLGAKDWYYNQSLEGFLARSFHTPIVILSLTYSLTILIVALTWLKGRKLNNLRLWAAVSSLYLIVHPIALQHYFAFSIIPLILLSFDLWQSKGSKKLWLLVAVCYVLIAKDIRGFEQIPAKYNFILSHQFYAIFALWVLALWKNNSWKVLGIMVAVATLVGSLSVIACQMKICF